MNSPFELTPKAENKKEILKEKFFQGTSAQLCRALCEYLGNKIDDGSFPSGVQEFHLADGTIVSVDFKLRKAKFSLEEDKDPITLQIEKGVDCWQTTWEELDNKTKNEIFLQIVP